MLTENGWHSIWQLKIIGMEFDVSAVSLCVTPQFQQLPSPHQKHTINFASTFSTSAFHASLLVGALGASSLGGDSTH